MKVSNPNLKYIYTAVLVEYGFLCILLCSIDRTTGLLTAPVAALVHLVLRKRTILLRDPIKRYALTFCLSLIDFLLVGGGLLSRFFLLDPKLIRNPEALLDIGRYSLLVTGGVLVVRTIFAIALPVIWPPSKAGDPTLGSNEQHSGESDNKADSE